MLGPIDEVFEASGARPSVGSTLASGGGGPSGRLSCSLGTGRQKMRGDCDKMHSAGRILDYIERERPILSSYENQNQLCDGGAHGRRDSEAGLSSLVGKWKTRRAGSRALGRSARNAASPGSPTRRTSAPENRGVPASGKRRPQHPSGHKITPSFCPRDFGELKYRRL